MAKERTAFRMRKSILVLPAVAAVLTFGAGAAAQASVHPANVVGALADGNGTAGYYTQEFGRTYTQVNGSFKLNLPSADQLFNAQNGAIGIQLCNATSGYVAQLGVIADPGDARILEWLGTASGVPAPGDRLGDLGRPLRRQLVLRLSSAFGHGGFHRAGSCSGRHHGPGADQGSAPRSALHGRGLQPGELQLLPANPSPASSTRPERVSARTWTSCRLRLPMT